MNQITLHYSIATTLVQAIISTDTLIAKPLVSLFLSLSFSFCFQCNNHIDPSTITLKDTSDNYTLVFKALQWLPTSFQVKYKIVNTAFTALYSLISPTSLILLTSSSHCSLCCSHSQLLRVLEHSQYTPTSEPLLL